MGKRLVVRVWSAEEKLGGLGDDDRGSADQEGKYGGTPGSPPYRRGDRDKQQDWRHHHGAKTFDHMVCTPLRRSPGVARAEVVTHPFVQGLRGVESDEHSQDEEGNAEDGSQQPRSVMRTYSHDNCSHPLSRSSMASNDFTAAR
jgi:hypothetical protein